MQDMHIRESMRDAGLDLLCMPELAVITIVTAPSHEVSAAEGKKLLARALIDVLILTLGRARSWIMVSFSTCAALIWAFVTPVSSLVADITFAATRVQDGKQTQRLEAKGLSLAGDGSASGHVEAEKGAEASVGLRGCRAGLADMVLVTEARRGLGGGGLLEFISARELLQFSDSVVRMEGERASSGWLQTTFEDPKFPRFVRRE